MKTMNLGILLLSLNMAQAEAGTIRAAFELGSDAFKMQVAEIDTDHHTVSKIISSKIIEVALNPNFDSALVNEKFATLLNEAKQAQATEFSAVAIQAFRRAENAPEILASLQKQEPRLQITVLSQELELQLALLSVQASLDANEGILSKAKKIIKKRDVILWDIEAGGTQMIRQTPEGEFIQYKTQVGARFAEETINKIKAYNANRKVGPIIPLEADMGDVQLTEKFQSEFDNPATHLSDLLSVRNPIIVGIGKVQNSLILGKKAIRKNSYSSNDILRTLNSIAGTTDEEIENFYEKPSAGTDVTNLMLIYSFFSFLKTDRIRLMDVNLTDGLLLYPDLNLTGSAP